MELAGILPALVTPFDEDGRFQERPFERLLERLYASGIDGVYVTGSTGEGLLQPVEQRKRVAEAAVQLSPRGKQVIVHTGAHRTADAVELTRHAARAGAAAASSLPPMGVYSFAEIRAYYAALANAAEIPFLVYYFPLIAPAIANLEQILELCALPNVVGLKFTDHDLYKLSRVRATGAGGIGSFYNLVPELFVELRQLALRGQWDAARAVQERINELIVLTLRYPVFPAIKTILRWTGIECGRCLEPKRSLTVEEEDGLRAALRASSFARLAGEG
jgi:N-acetylneuraminate lyase